MGHFSTPGMGTYGSTWQARGYSGRGNVGCLIDTLRGKAAVVCGSGRDVFKEFEQVRKFFDYQNLVVFGVNDVGMYLPRLDHWISLHDDRLPIWKAVRWMHAPAGAEQVFYHGVDAKSLAKGIIQYHWAELTPLFALSGYFAMQIAWIMGASPIILAGCPGDKTPRFFEATSRDGFSYGEGRSNSDNGIKRQVITEMDRNPEFKAIVRSTSGWTREYFGGF